MTVSAQSPYILFWDITTTLHEGGIEEILAFIEQCSPIEIAGMPAEHPLKFDPRCLLVNAALLRRAGVYQVLLDNQSTRPLDVLQRYLMEYPVAGYAWPPSLQQAVALAADNVSLRSGSQSVQEPTPGLLTVAVCTYGDFPVFIDRCMKSILREPRGTGGSSIIVGCNAVSAATVAAIVRNRDCGWPVSIALSRHNLNKSGMRRILLTLAESEYVASIDDDITLKPGWLRKLQRFLTTASEGTLDATGCTLLSRYRPLQVGLFQGEFPYSCYPLRKRWWRWKKPTDGPDILFPAGGFHVMRTDFVRTHDYPDFQMLIDFDDILLGDLILQTGGVYSGFPLELVELIIVELNRSRGVHGSG
jgi:hypothetical protein